MTGKCLSVVRPILDAMLNGTVSRLVNQTHTRTKIGQGTARCAKIRPLADWHMMRLIDSPKALLQELLDKALGLGLFQEGVLLPAMVGTREGGRLGREHGLTPCSCDCC